jgi:hypothetical protein
MPHKKIAPSLLALAMVSDLLYIFFFSRLDNLIHTDLYRYGLQFSNVWANAYWSYSTWMIGLQMAAIILVAVSIILVLVDTRSLKARFRSSCSALLTLGVVLNLSNIFLFLQVDNIVNQDLYNFGLQFSPEWANIYWIYAKLMIALPIATSVLIISPILIILFLSKRNANTKIATSKILSAAILLIGAITLFLSIYATSSLLAFTGLGLVFWGAILTYVRTDEYVKKALLTASSPYPLINQAIRELGFKGAVIYLPPKYFKDPRRTKIFVARQEGIVFPKPEEVQEHEGLALSEIQGGIIMDPLGRDLSVLFERTLGRDFTKVDMNYLEQQIPKLLIEELEIVTNLDISYENDRIKLKVKNSVFNYPRENGRKTPTASTGFGSTFASAIACSLAKGTGKAILIEREETDGNGRTLSIEYRTVNEPSA